ncbi:hypothetical protein IQ06DRAFT_30408 [Phaeosphaeriaceae sp. SRC1lsM3a]|nr:hypothetical protein IQ06DRAFT_30408 [Stagonospora sp. SRC1lsM3a]
MLLLVCHNLLSIASKAMQGQLRTDTWRSAAHGTTIIGKTVSHGCQQSLQCSSCEGRRYDLYICWSYRPLLTHASAQNVLQCLRRIR